MVNNNRDYLRTPENKEKLRQLNLGEKNPVFGRKFSRTEEMKRKMGVSRIGEKNPFFAKHHSEETKGRLREAFLKLWQDPDFVGSVLTSMNHLGVREKMSKLRLDAWQDTKYVRRQMESRGVTPNKSELKLTSILQGLNLPYKFVGDGEVIIGGKCPDYINVDGQKKIIELFGDYWHSELVKGHPVEEEIRLRISHFAQFGFKTLIIWESELLNIKSLKRKILVFEETK